VANGRKPVHQRQSSLLRGQPRGVGGEQQSRHDLPCARTYQGKQRRDTGVRAHITRTAGRPQAPTARARCPRGACCTPRRPRCAGAQPTPPRCWPRPRRPRPPARRRPTEATGRAAASRRRRRRRRRSPGTPRTAPCVRAISEDVRQPWRTRAPAGATRPATLRPPVAPGPSTPCPPAGGPRPTKQAATHLADSAASPASSTRASSHNSSAARASRPGSEAYSARMRPRSAACAAAPPGSCQDGCSTAAARSACGTARASQDRRTWAHAGRAREGDGGGK
jgi:hypothetical protein